MLEFCDFFFFNKSYDIRKKTYANPIQLKLLSLVMWFTVLIVEESLPEAETEVGQIPLVQRVSQEQVGGQRPCQEEAVQRQSRDRPQHQQQLQADRVTQVQQQPPSPTRFI